MPDVWNGRLHLETDLPTLRREVHRKGFHMISGVAAAPLVLYAGLEYATLVLVVSLAFLSGLELLYWRLGYRVPLVTREFDAIRRPGETFSWASTLFLFAILVILWLVPLPLAFATLAMLALGDGSSAIFGRAFGRHKLRWNRGKSWEGSLAGLLLGAAGGVAMAAWYYAANGADGARFSWPGATVVPIVLAGSLAAAFVESLPSRQDNLNVPLAAGLVMTALWTLSGLEPRVGELFLRLSGG